MRRESDLLSAASSKNQLANSI